MVNLLLLDKYMDNMSLEIKNLNFLKVISADEIISYYFMLLGTPIYMLKKNIYIKNVESETKIIIIIIKLL